MRAVSRFLVAVALAVALAVAAGGALAAQDAAPAPDAESFARGVEDARAAMRERDWKTARAALLELVALHGPEPYVRARRSDLEEDLVRCDFWIAHPEPDLDALLSGEVVLWDARAGEIVVRYSGEPESLADFERNRPARGALALFVSPIEFDGPYALEWLGSGAQLAGLETIVAMEPDEHYHALVAGSSRAYGHALSWRNGDDVTLLELAEAEPIAADARLRVRVEVGRRRLVVQCNGRTVLRASKRRTLFGGFAFTRAHPRFERLTVSGRVDRDWIDALYDEALAEERDLFEWDPRAVLPAWLYDAPAPDDEPERLAEELERLLFANPQDRAHWARIEQWRAEDEHALAIEYVAGLAPERASRPFRAYALAILWTERGRPVAAWEHVERLNELLPGLYHAECMRAAALVALGRRDEAEALLRSLVERHPSAELAHQLLVQLLVRADRPLDAKAALEDALLACSPSNRLDALLELLARATRGPDWERTHEWETEHYRVRSDVDRTTCIVTARELEHALAVFGETFGVVPEGDATKFDVYVFADRDDYLAYAGTPFETGTTGTVGIYDAVVRQLLIWNQVDEERTKSTIRHEGFHQYLDSWLEDPPVWLNEGLAEYVEASFVTKRDFVPGTLQHEHVARLADGRALEPLSDFLHLPQKEFMRRGLDAYAQAWAFVHFLLHAPGQRLRFNETLALLESGATSEDVLRRLFDPASVERLERDFRIWVRTFGK